MMAFFLQAKFEKWGHDRYGQRAETRAEPERSESSNRDKFVPVSLPGQIHQDIYRDKFVPVNL